MPEEIFDVVNERDEVIGRPIPREGWDDNVLAELERFKALVVGPGLGRNDEQGAAVCGLVSRAPTSAIVDADGLYALENVERAAEVIRPRSDSTVLTPHEGEFPRLFSDISNKHPYRSKLERVRAAAVRSGAIVLLKQAVEFEPDHSQAWYILGQCQERNPKWRRDAAESYQRSLSVDPNNVDALISLGDLYKSEGLGSRAQSCYEDVIKIQPENQQAKSRLQGFKKR